MTRRRRIQPVYNPDANFVTNVSSKEESYAGNAYKHIKYIYWMQFITLALLIFVVLYVYLKGMPVKVR